jgi:purine catabolism regulator
VRIEEVLDLPVVQAGRPEVLVGGATQMAREIRWVYMGEISDIARYVHGGELLLTAATGLSSSRERRRNYIREIAAAGVLALVIELGRALHQVPAEMIAEAEERDLVLVALHRDVKWISITEAVHSTIINQHAQVIRQAEELGREFTGLVLAEATLGQILDRLALALGCPVVFEDVAHQPVAWGGEPEPRTLDHWNTHSWATHAEPPGGEMIRRGGDDDALCYWTPIVLRSEQVGRLHVFQGDQAGAELTPLAIDRAGVALSLSIALDRRSDQLAEDARRVLLADVRAGSIGGGRAVLSRARALGAQFKGQVLFAIVLRMMDADATTESDHLVTLSVIHALLRDEAAAAGAPFVSAVEGDRVVGLVGAPSAEDVRTVADRLGSVLETEQISGARLGASRGAELSDLPTAFREAEEASHHESANPIVHYDELGLEQLLRPLLDGAALARYVDAEIGPLLSFGARSGVDLVETLKVYLGTGRNKAEASRQLHLDRSSLYGRLQKLEQILDRDLDDPDDCLRLNVAMSALRLIRSSRGTSSAL